MKKRIIFSGGGTAGHVWPLISVYKAMEKDFEALYLGTGDEKERQLVERAGIKYRKIISGKYRRYFSLANFIDPFKVILGIIQSFLIMLFFRPQIVFTKGGYVTVPVGIASFLTARKLVIHESDSVMGLANRILAKLAKKVFCAFPIESYPKNIRNKAVFVGVPVRPEILTGDRGKARDDFEFSPGPPTVLFIGGSSGAKGVNDFVSHNLDKLIDFCQVIHITGKNDYPKIRQRALELSSKKQKKFRYFNFVTHELPDILSLSDLVISRAGATTIFELAALSKPTIFIPYPYAAANHQFVNAKILERAQAGVLMEEGKFTDEQLIAQIKRLLDNQKAMANLSKNIHKFYQSNSAERIGQQLEILVRAGRGLL